MGLSVHGYSQRNIADQFEDYNLSQEKNLSIIFRPWAICKFSSLLPGALPTGQIGCSAVNTQLLARY